MMAEANSAAEMAMAKAAAKTFWLVEAIMGQVLWFGLSARPSCRMSKGLQEPCQTRETADFGGFRAMRRRLLRSSIRKIGKFHQQMGIAHNLVISGLVRDAGEALDRRAKTRLAARTCSQILPEGPGA